jgi:hypothetical protein
MDDANTNVNDVIIGDGMLGKVGNCSSPELVRNKELKPLWRMPLQGHDGVIGFVIAHRCVAALHDKPGNHLAKIKVGVIHLDLFAWMFECNQDEVKESIN